MLKALCFIVLTNTNGIPLHINVDKIVAVGELGYRGIDKTVVYFAGANHLVLESPEIVLNKIKEECNE